MSQGVLRTFVIALSAGFMLAAASSSVYAIDSNNRYFAYGLGERSCEDYLKFRDRKLETLEQQNPRSAKTSCTTLSTESSSSGSPGF